MNMKLNRTQIGGSAGLTGIGSGLLKGQPVSSAELVRESDAYSPCASWVRKSTGYKGPISPLRMPLIIGHRGLASRAPENTIASYKMALEAGLAMVECDVHTSADGVPVLMHDASLERTTGAKGRVSEKTLEELRALDAGAWKGEEFRFEGIPTLSDFLKLCRERSRVAIEIKDPSDTESVVASIEQSDFPLADVNIFAWEAEVILKSKTRLPQADATWLVANTPSEPSERLALIERAVQAGATHLGVKNINCDQDFFDSVHCAGLRVFVWTVNDLDQALELAENGADGIISDCGDAVRRRLAHKCS